MISTTSCIIGRVNTVFKMLSYFYTTTKLSGVFYFIDHESGSVLKRYRKQKDGPLQFYNETLDGAVDCAFGGFDALE